MAASTAAVRDLLSNPKTLTGIQILSGGVVLGVTSPTSVWRPALIPVGVSLVYLITAARKGGGGQSLGMLLQYVDLALIKRWAYCPEADALLRDGIITVDKEEVKSNGHAVANGRANGHGVKREQANGSTIADVCATDKKYGSTNGHAIGAARSAATERTTGRRGAWLRRAWLGFGAMFSFRRVNTPDQVKSVPPSPTSSRLLFCLRAASLWVLTNLGLEFVDYLRLLGRRYGDFSNERTLFFTSILKAGRVDGVQLLFRISSTFCWWFGVACLLSQGYEIASIIAVGLGLSEPRAWRPLFGDLRKATSLRGLWGDAWHQLLRGPFSGLTEIAAHDILRLPRRGGSLTTRYLKVLVTFTVSGVYHVIEELGNGTVPLSESGAMRFFLMQAVGIMVEERVRAWTKGTWLAESRLGSVVGYVWVGAWLTWTTPSRSYPNLRGHTQPYLEVSVLRGLGIVPAMK